MGQDQTKQQQPLGVGGTPALTPRSPLTPQEEQYYAAEAARMHHVTTREAADLHRRTNQLLYEREAQRILGQLEGLQPVGPLVRSTVDTSFVVNPKEKMMNELAANATGGAGGIGVLPYDALVRAMASYQTIDMREAVVATKRQEDLTARMNNLSSALQATKNTIAHQSHCLSAVSAAIADAERVRHHVDAVSLAFDELAGLLLQIDDALTEEERVEVQDTLTAPRSRTSSTSGVH